MAKIREKKKLPEEVKGLLLLGASFLFLLATISFSRLDPGSNWLGLLGYGIGWLLSYLFGLTSYMVIGYLGFLGYKLVSADREKSFALKHLYFSLFFISIAVLLNLVAEKSHGFGSLFESKIHSESVLLDFPYPHRALRYNLGGVPLYYLYRDLPTCNLQMMLSNFGVGFIFSLTGLVSFLLLTEIELMPHLRALHAFAMKKREVPEVAPEVKDFEEIEKSLLSKRAAPPPLYVPEKQREMRIRTLSDSEVKERPKIEQKPKKNEGDFTAYQLPPPSLLTNPKKVDQPSLKKDLHTQAETLEETLMSFGIEAKVGEINCGPTITSFEVHPAIGVKVQKIKTVENDIALNLQAKSIRIIAPIPGKAAVGVEIPSLFPQEVGFKEMLLSYQQNPRKFLIPVLLGKTVTGESVMSDLAKMPHCIIAGATGSGKSVCINTVIMSILMNARPDEIKLLLVDPKKVELTSYAKLPHLIAPVITEPHGAYAALNFLVKEMQKRYDMLKQLGLRNILAFNNRQINRELEASLNIPIPEKMHAIVAIIDEFADLMMASSSDLETPIARIAQMARAVGIHLILATQRPSREVITGLIKANFPTRIAFKVASRINSQIILDENGAESLLGNGDMLFLPPGSSQLMRAQGAYISDEDINKVIHFICDQAPPNYLIESFDNMRKDEGEIEGDEGSRDTLYEQAKAIVVETRTASTTYLQRKLKIGYARAASLMDELEGNGIIGPQEGSKPRRVLLNDNSYEEQQ